MLEMLMLALALPNALEAVCCLLARARRRPHNAAPRAWEIEITLRLRIRRGHALRQLSATARDLG